MKKLKVIIGLQGTYKIKAATASIILAFVGLTVVNSAFVFLLDICENVGLTFF